MQEKTNSKLTEKADTEKSRNNKFFTKERICFFIVGLLLGAGAASACFLIYINNANNNLSTVQESGFRRGMMNGNTHPEMPNGEKPTDMPNGEIPPEMPDGETPPELPNSEKSTETSTDETK